MELKVTRHGAASQVAVLHPGAQVDGRSAFQFEQDVLELLQDGTKYVVVDFAAVNLFASAGIRVLILLLHKLDARDGALVLSGLNQYIRNVLDVSGLTSQFTLVANIADAVKAMPAGEDTSETGQLARRVLKLLSIGDPVSAGASAVPEPVAQELADRAMHALSKRR
ncbi:MAG: STAS domain-containing protein [Vicinamibacteraceae bacterium]